MNWWRCLWCCSGASESRVVEEAVSCRGEVCSMAKLQQQQQRLLVVTRNDDGEEECVDDDDDVDEDVGDDTVGWNKLRHSLGDGLNGH